MYQIIFLSILALVWIIFAAIQDLKSREIANWLNFSLIIFALGFRFFYSLFRLDNLLIPLFNFKTLIFIFHPLKGILFVKEILTFIHLFLANFPFFYQGLIGLGIFFILGNLFYYGRMFAGGDSKLIFALGAVLPFSENFLINLKIFALFFFVFLFVGAVYGLSWSIVLTLKNFRGFKKEFSKKLKKNKKILYPIMSLGLILIVLGFIENVLFFLGILIFVLPYFYIYAKAVDEACMVKKIKTNNLREGDWLYKNLRIGGKLLKANWDGLNKQQIKEIKKRYKEVKIKQGIPFTPVFLISFLILIFLYFFRIGLWNSFW